MPPAESALEEDVLTVEELNGRIGEVVEGADRLQDVRCLGEVARVNASDWGVFIDLVAEGATIRALVWGSRYLELDLQLEPGMELLVEGAVDYFRPGGTISLHVWNATVVGDGDQAFRLKRLREELAERGWFDEEAKRPLPRFPSRVGVVAPPGSDVRETIVESIHERDPEVDVALKDARMQGRRAPRSIANGIRWLDRREEVDVVVVARTGGSEADLMPFNSEAVAEAIFGAETPVVAAVGHPHDEPIACEVADETAITPTRVGPLVAEDRSALESEVATLAERLDRSFGDAVASSLSSLDRRVEDAYEAAVARELSRLDRRLDRAYEDRKRTIEHRATTRRYRVAMAGLAALVLALSLFVLLL